MAASSQGDDGLAIIGRVAGVYGVRGWLKVRSHTRDRAAIAAYPRWLIRTGGAWQEYEVTEVRAHGQGIVAHLMQVDDRDRAAALVGADIAIHVQELPPLAAGEYYWTQLQGLRVVNLQAVEFGRVERLLETGANDVIVVVGARERLIPYIAAVVKEVDLAAGLLRVDWDADF